VPLKIRGSIYKACIRSVLLYGSETWALTKRLEELLRVNDSRMMRYMAGVKWEQRVPNEQVEDMCGVRQLRFRLRQGRLRWFGHVTRAGEESMLGRVKGMEVPESRPRSRLKTVWMENVRRDLSEFGLTEEEEARDRERWEGIIRRPTAVMGRRGRCKR